MQKFKKSGILCLVLALLFATSCTQTAEIIPKAEETAVLNVYATFYPLYAITSMLIEDTDVQLNCLVQPQDGCLRDYSLSDWDLALLTGSADIVIAGGCGLESFENILYALGDDGPAVSAILYDMELTEQHATNTLDDTESHWLDANPHIYMSIDGAIEIAERIAASLSLLDNKNETVYAQNLESARTRLESLQESLHEAMDGARKRRVIVMNEALVYAAKEYGLKVDLYYERESGEDVQGYDWENCLEVLNDSDSRIVLLEKQAPQNLVASLQDAGFIVVKMDTTSTRRADEGADGYFEAHRENVQALLSAFEEASRVL